MHHVDAIVVYGTHGKRFLVEQGISPEKIFIAWQTVDNELFGRHVKDGEIDSARKRYHIPEGKQIVLYVGRFIDLKGIRFLLEAFEKMDKDSFVFVAIGDGELKGEMEEYCKGNGVDFRFTGLINYVDLPPFYKMATVLVLPSITTDILKEAWGLVVNEAFNQGCPVIVTDAVGAGVGGLVEDGVNGYVVPERDPEALKNALYNLLSNIDLRARMSVNARAEIEKWTYERQAKGFMDAVDFVARGRGDLHESS